MWGYQSNQIPVPNPERQLNNPAHLWNNKVDCPTRSLELCLGASSELESFPIKIGTWISRPSMIIAPSIRLDVSWFCYLKSLLPSTLKWWSVLSSSEHPFRVAASLNVERKGQDLVASQGRGTCCHCQKSFVHGAWPWKAGERAGCLQRTLGSPCGFKAEKAVVNIGERFGFWDSYAWHFLDKPLQDFGPKGWLHVLCFPNPGRLHSPIQSGKRPISAQRPEAVWLWTKLKPRPSINLIQVRCFKIWYRHRKAIEIGFRAPNFLLEDPWVTVFRWSPKSLTPWCFGLGHVATRFPKNARLNLLDALASRR